MATKCYRVHLSSDAVQPITVPCGAQFLTAVRWPDEIIEMHFMGDDQADAMTMIVEQVDLKTNTDSTEAREGSVRYISSVSGIWKSAFVTTHLFEVLP